MNPEKRLELSTKVNKAALKYKATMEPNSTGDVDSAKAGLEAALQEMRLTRLQSIAEQVANGYSIVIFRSKSPQLFSNQILTQLKASSPDSLLGYVNLLADALRITKRTRTDEPFQAVGLYDSESYSWSLFNKIKQFKNGLSYSGIIIRVALESYIYSLLEAEQLGAIEMFYLDFSAENIETGHDESSKLFQDFEQLLLQDEITEKSLQEFDIKAKEYIAHQKAIGNFNSYSQEGRDSINSRISTEDSYEGISTLVQTSLKSFGFLEDKKEEGATSSLLVTGLMKGISLLMPKPKDNSEPKQIASPEPSSAPK